MSYSTSEYFYFYFVFTPMAPPHAPALFSDTYPVLVEEKHTGDKNVRLPILGREENKELFGILKEPTETKGEEIFPSVEEDMIETLRKQQNRDNKIEENDATCSRDNEDETEEMEEQMVSVIQPKVTSKKNRKKKNKNKKGAEIGFQREEQGISVVHKYTSLVSRAKVLHVYL